MKKEIGFIGLGKMGTKANCFAFDGFARPESLRGETMQIQGLLCKTDGGKLFYKAGIFDKLFTICICAKK